MIIDQFPSLATPQASDEIPIERGTTTYKTTYGAIVGPLNLSFATTDNSWSAIYSVLSKIQGQNSAFFLAQGAASSVLTSGKYTNALKGVVNRAATGVYDFIAYTGHQPQYIWVWHISGFTSASETPTVGTIHVYKSAEETATQLNLIATDTTWAAIYNRLSQLPVRGTATLFIMNTTASSLLTNGKVSILLAGMVVQSNDGTYEFMMKSINSSYIYIWRIEGLTSATATPTIGTVYRFTGTAI